MEKFFIVDTYLDDDNNDQEEKVNILLEKGWTVKMIAPMSGTKDDEAYGMVVLQKED